MIILKYAAVVIRFCWLGASHAKNKRAGNGRLTQVGSDLMSVTVVQVMDKQFFVCNIRLNA